MTFDPSKLRPLPLTVREETWNGPRTEGTGLWLVEEADGNGVATYQYPDDAEFHVLARQAFDVMMRRGWWACRIAGSTPIEWRVSTYSEPSLTPTNSGFRSWCRSHAFSDPFTALVAADRWLREREVKADG